MHLSRTHLMQVDLVSTRFTELIKIRLPWLIIGLAGGLLVSVIVSRFELSLRENIALAFFIPIIAYMSDSIGTQTETILIRALTDLKFSVPRYILREIVVGLVMGAVMGSLVGVFGLLLSNSQGIGITVGLSIWLSMTMATALACFTPIILRGMGKDPAVGSGPFTTAIQDIVSLTIYFTVASIIL